MKSPQSIDEKIGPEKGPTLGNKMLERLVENHGFVRMSRMQEPTRGVQRNNIKVFSALTDSGNPAIKILLEVEARSDDFFSRSPLNNYLIAEVLWSTDDDIDVEEIFLQILERVERGEQIIFCHARQAVRERENEAAAERQEQDILRELRGPDIEMMRRHAVIGAYVAGLVSAILGCQGMDQLLEVLAQHDIQIVSHAVREALSQSAQIEQGANGDFFDALATKLSFAVGSLPIGASIGLVTSSVSICVRKAVGMLKQW